MNTIIALENVGKLYERQIVLEEINLKIEQGEFVFLVGCSGAGKTTLLKLIGGYITPSYGTIMTNGINVALLKSKEIPNFRRKLGIFDNNIGLIPYETIYDNLNITMIATNQPRKNRRQRVLLSLDLVGMLDKVDKYPQELSKGEEAKILLARAIVTAPDILLVDEPTANLSPSDAYDIMHILARINKQGITVVVASHDREHVTILNKRVVTLVLGAMVSDKKNAGYESKLMDIFEENKVIEKRKKFSHNSKVLDKTVDKVIDSFR